MPVKPTSLSLSALPSPSDRQFRNQNQLVEPDSVFSQEFIEQAYDRLVSGLHYSAWAHQLKLSWIGDAAGYGARFGLHALGRKINLLRRLPFLDVSQLLSDEIVSGYVTQQYRVEDQGNHAWRNEVIEGLVARGLTLGSTHALKGLGFFLTGARGLAVQGLLMGVGLLIGEQITTRLFNSKIQTAGSFAGVLLRLFDTQLMMAKGRVMKPLMLDESLARMEQKLSIPSTAMTAQKLFAGDQHQVTSETSGVIRGGIPESKALVHQPKERQNFPTRITTDSGQRLVSTMSQQECHTALATYKRNARACLMILYENGFITRDVYQTLNQRLSSQHDRERAQARTFIRLYGALVRGSRDIADQRLFRNVIESNGWQLTADNGRYSLVGESDYHEAVRFEEIVTEPATVDKPEVQPEAPIFSDETALALIKEDTPETGIAARLKDALSTQKQSDIIPNKNLAERIADYISQGQFRRAASLLEAIHSPQVCTRLFQAFGGLDSIQGYDHPIDPALMARVWQHMSPEATARILITLNHQAEQDSRRSPYPDAVEVELFDEWTLNIMAWMQIDELDSPSPQAQETKGPLSRTAVILGSLAEHPDSRSFATRMITRGLQPEHSAYDAVAHTVHELSESVPGFLSLEQIIAADYNQVCQSSWQQRRRSVLPQPSTTLFDQNAQLKQLKQRLTQLNLQDDNERAVVSDTLLLTFPPATARELLAEHGDLDTLSQLLRHQTPETASAFLGLWGAQKDQARHDIERAHVLHHLWEQKDGQTYVEQAIRCAAEDPDATASVQRALHLETTDALVPSYLKAGMEEMYIDLASPDIPGPLAGTLNTPEDFMDTGVLKPEDLIGEHQQRALDRILVRLQTSDQETQARVCDLLVRIAQEAGRDLPPILTFASWANHPVENAGDYVKRLKGLRPFKACIDHLMRGLPFPQHPFTPKGMPTIFDGEEVTEGQARAANLQELNPTERFYWETLCQMGEVAAEARQEYLNSYKDSLNLGERVTKFGLVCPEVTNEALHALSHEALWEFSKGRVTPDYGGYNAKLKPLLQALADLHPPDFFNFFDRFIELRQSYLKPRAPQARASYVFSLTRDLLDVCQSYAKDSKTALLVHQRLQSVYFQVGSAWLPRQSFGSPKLVTELVDRMIALEQANPDNDRAYPVYLDILAREGLNNIVANPQTGADSYLPATKAALQRLQIDEGLDQASPAVLDFVTDSDKPVTQRAQVLHRLALVTDKPLAGVARDDLPDDLLARLLGQAWDDYKQGALLLPPDVLAAELDGAVRGRPIHGSQVNGNTLVELLDKTADQPGFMTREQARAAMFDLLVSGRATNKRVADKVGKPLTKLYHDPEAGQAVYRILCSPNYFWKMREMTYESFWKETDSFTKKDSQSPLVVRLETDQYPKFYAALVRSPYPHIYPERMGTYNTRTAESLPLDRPWSPYHVIAAFCSESSANFLVEQGRLLSDSIITRADARQELGDLMHALVIRKPDYSYSFNKELVRFYYDIVVESLKAHEAYLKKREQNPPLLIMSEPSEYLRVALRAQAGLFQLGQKGAETLKSVLDSSERAKVNSILSPENPKWIEGAERTFRSLEVLDRYRQPYKSFPARAGYNVEGVLVFTKDIIAFCQHLGIPLADPD